MRTTARALFSDSSFSLGLGRKVDTGRRQCLANGVPDMRFLAACGLRLLESWARAHEPGISGSIDPPLHPLRSVRSVSVSRARPEARATVRPCSDPMQSPPIPFSTTSWAADRRGYNTSSSEWRRTTNNVRCSILRPARYVPTSVSAASAAAGWSQSEPLRR